MGCILDEHSIEGFGSGIALTDSTMAQYLREKWASSEGNIHGTDGGLSDGRHSMLIYFPCKISSITKNGKSFVETLISMTLRLFVLQAESG
jgi:hypothetical protein